MSAKTKARPQRVRYSDDQLLAASDLNLDEAYEDSMRRMHIRGLHDTWGVSLGYYLSLSNEENQVLLGPGLAYDALGRELLLADTLNLPAPEPEGSFEMPLAYDLVISATELSEMQAERQRRGTCARVLAEGIHLRWVLAGKVNSFQAETVSKLVKLGLEVPLGRFIYFPSSGTFSGPDLSFRTNARPLLRPHMVLGKISLNQVGLTPDVLAGQVEIDTSAAGFSSQTQYFVWMPQNPLAKINNVTKIWGPFLSVVDPAMDRFTLKVFFASPFNDPQEIFMQMEDLLGAYGETTEIFWLGVEPVTGCRPQPNFVELIARMNGLVQNPALLWSNAMKPFGWMKEVKG